MSRSNYKPYIKIWFIRYQENLSRPQFSEITGVSARTIEGIENKGIDPKISHVQSICKAFPEYSLWMMIDEVDLGIGQISPMIKNFWLNRLDTPELKSERNIVFDRKNISHIASINRVVERHHGGDADIEYPFHSSAYDGINLDL